MTLSGRFFLFVTCIKVSGFWTWMAVLGFFNPRGLYRAGVRFKQTGRSFKMTYDKSKCD